MKSIGGHTALVVAMEWKRELVVKVLFDISSFHIVLHFQEILRFSKQRRELGAAVSVDDPVIKLASSNKQDFLIGDMKRLWRSLEGQDDGAEGKGEEAAVLKPGTGGKQDVCHQVMGDKQGGKHGGGKQDVCQVMGDMKLLWKSFVGPLPDGSVGQVGQ